MAEQHDRDEEKWHIHMVRPGLPGLDRLPDLGLPDLSRLPWMNRPIRPADIGGELRDAMLARESWLEDVNYQKVIPNYYIVEVSEANYARHFRPIEAQVIRQWRERLLEELVTANSRQGRKEFRFGGRLRLEVRPATDLKDPEARILSRIAPDAGSPPVQRSQRSAASPAGAPNATGSVAPPSSARPYVSPPMRRPAGRPSSAGQAQPTVRGPEPQTGGRAQNQQNQPANPPATRPEPPRQVGRSATPPGGSAATSAYLELVPSGQRWALYPGYNTIGRSEACQIYLDQPIIQEKRLISGQHAFIVMENGVCTIYDGSPDGRPSANGTYINLRRVPPTGYRLQNGDAIVLAALDPLFPRSDTPGVATFYFWTDRRP